MDHHRKAGSGRCQEDQGKVMTGGECEGITSQDREADTHSQYISKSPSRAQSPKKKSSEIEQNSL